MLLTEAVESIASLAPCLLLPVGPRCVSLRALPTVGGVLFPAGVAVSVNVGVVVGERVTGDVGSRLTGFGVGDCRGARRRLAGASGGCRCLVKTTTRSAG